LVQSTAYSGKHLGEDSSSHPWSLWISTRGMGDSVWNRLLKL